MASVNPHTRELVFKLVFYGPGLGGKTTTLQYIHAATKPEHRGKMVSLATPTDRTLYFDFLPIRVPRVRGMAVHLALGEVVLGMAFEAGIDHALDLGMLFQPEKGIFKGPLFAELLELPSRRDLVKDPLLVRQLTFLAVQLERVHA